MPIRAHSPALDPTRPIGPASRPLLDEHFARGCKPRASWALGAELELFAYERDTLERIDARTVESILADFAPHATRLVREGEQLIEVWGGWGGVTVEPGGQIEFSGTRHRGLADLERDARRYLGWLAEIAEQRRLVFVASGFDPLRSAGEQRWFPKRRYAILRPYLATRGQRGLDMMCRTASIQANLDYGSIEDLAKKFLAGNRLGPIVSAIFANSPFQEGKLSGYKSTRGAVWLDTDPDRSGVSPVALLDNFSVEKFVDYALEVPMVFVRRDGDYIDRAGEPFAHFLARERGRTQPIFQDFADHLTTIFTEARLKQHVELRSADAGSCEWMLALQAFWKGLFYDTSSLNEALALAPRLDRAGFVALAREVARHGLAARAGGVRVLDLAREAVRLAIAGLARVAPDETRYLDVLAHNIVNEGLSSADILVRDFRGSWNGDITRAIDAMRVC
jgi:glutamate--cysteine ligase